MRPVSAVIIICLPLTRNLDITGLLSIIMALIALTVVWENVASLMRGAKFWEKWENTKYPAETQDISSRHHGEDVSNKNARNSGLNRNSTSAV